MLLGVAAINFFTLLIPLAQSGEQLIIIRLLTGIGHRLCHLGAVPDRRRADAGAAPSHLRRDLRDDAGQFVYLAAALSALSSPATQTVSGCWLCRRFSGCSSYRCWCYLADPREPALASAPGQSPSGGRGRQPDHRPRAAIASRPLTRRRARSRTPRRAREQLPSFTALFRPGQLRWTVVGICRSICAQVSFFTISRFCCQRLWSIRVQPSPELWAELAGIPGEHPGQGFYRVLDGDHRAAVDDHLLPRRLASRTADDGGGASRRGLTRPSCSSPER